MPAKLSSRRGTARGFAKWAYAGYLCLQFFSASRPPLLLVSRPGCCAGFPVQWSATTWRNIARLRRSSGREAKERPRLTSRRRGIAWRQRQHELPKLQRGLSRWALTGGDRLSRTQRLVFGKPAFLLGMVRRQRAGCVEPTVRPPAGPLINSAKPITPSHGCVSLPLTPPCELIALKNRPK